MRIVRRQFLIASGAFLATAFARAQPAPQVRRIAWLGATADSDLEAQQSFTDFKERLGALGWVDGRNLSIDARWGDGDAKRTAAYAKEIVALKPEVIVTGTTPATVAIHQETRTIPTVFVAVSDPVGGGFVKTLSRPGGNMTGFMFLNSAIAGKWLQLLKEIAPQVKHVAVIFNPKTATNFEYFLQPIREAAQKLEVTLSPAPIENVAELERVIADLGRDRSSGLVAMSDSYLFVQRRSVVAAAARHKVPAIYFLPSFVEDGGLVSYGPYLIDMYRRAAVYVDRILRGASPQNLPVEQPTKFQLVINMKTAKALGIAVSQPILLRADRVIE